MNVTHGPRFEVFIEQQTDHKPYIEYNGKVLYEKVSSYIVKARAVPRPQMGGISYHQSLLPPSNDTEFVFEGENLDELIVSLWRAFREHWKDHPILQEESTDGDHQT